MQTKENLTTLCGLSREETELDFSGQYLGAGDVVLIANNIIDMRALTSLDISNSNLTPTRKLKTTFETRQHLKALTPTRKALKIGDKTTFEEVEWTVASTPDSDGKFDAVHVGGVVAVANAIADMGALVCSDGKLYDNPLPANWIMIDHEGQPFYYNSVSEEGGFGKPAGDGPCSNCSKAKGNHKAKGAMTKFDISSNDIRAEGGKALAAGLKGNQMITELNISSNRLGKNIGYDHDASGVIALADAIPDMGALTDLNISNNNIGQVLWETSKNSKHPGEFFNTVEKKFYKELPAGAKAGKEPGVGVVALADIIKDMGAMTRLDISGNMICGLYADGSGTYNGAGVAALSAMQRANGALSSLHVGSNGIPEKEMREIIDIAANKESMKMLCEVPFKDKTITALDVSGKNLGKEGALVVAEYLDGNGALTDLNISNNGLGHDGAMAIANALKDSVNFMAGKDKIEILEATGWAKPLVDTFFATTAVGIVLAKPPSGNTELQNGSSVQGKLVLMDRGDCAFVEKAERAQAAGAIGAIIANNNRDNPDVILRMTDAAFGDTYAGDRGGNISIPVVAISFNAAQKMKESETQEMSILRQEGNRCVL
jgi:Leucine-rich repeat (LRR) protein